MRELLFTTKSSTINKVEFIEPQKLLEIEFRSGNFYRYHKVPRTLWKIFQQHIENSGSAGAFFNRHIKNQFNFERLKETNSDC